MVASPIWQNTAFHPDACSHVVHPEPLQKTVSARVTAAAGGPRSETRANRPALMPFLGDCAVRHMGRCCPEFENKLCSRHGRPATPICPWCPKGRVVRLNIKFYPWRAKGNDAGLDVCQRHCVRQAAASTIDRRFLLEEPLGISVRGELLCACLEAATREHGSIY